jgi:mono/diheme cytochrome c family protein
MIKVLKIGATVLLLLILTAGGYFLTLPQTAPASTETIAATPGQLARGDYLFNNVLGCPVCHSERNFDLFGAPPVPPFGGGRKCMAAGEKPPGLAEAGGMPGTLCFRNISSDKQTGVGEWTDGEILRAVREGIHRDGKGLFPMMPYFIYRNLSDADAAAVVAYVRTVPPVDNPLPVTDLDFPFSLFARLTPEPVDEPVAHPNEADAVEYGRYLTTVARCAFCHTPRDRSRQPLPGKDFAGGIGFQGREGIFYSTNLTTDPEGLGDMRVDEFIALFHRPAVPSTDELNLMPWTYFSGMSDADLGAIYAFLRTVTPQPFFRPGTE